MAEADHFEQVTNAAGEWDADTYEVYLDLRKLWAEVLKGNDWDMREELSWLGDEYRLTQAEADSANRAAGLRASGVSKRVARMSLGSMN